MKIVIFNSYVSLPEGIYDCHNTIATIWLFNSSPCKIIMLLIGKPSISMGHLYHGYVSHNQRVILWFIELDDGKIYFGKPKQIYIWW